jgi:hypothetical protein
MWMRECDLFYGLWKGKLLDLFKIDGAGVNERVILMSWASPGQLMGGIRFGMRLGVKKGDEVTNFRRGVAFDPIRGSGKGTTRM